MKFTYQYRTSDNAKHKGVIAAPNKDAAFALLKQNGIRAFGVEAAPGVFNKLFGRGKRWLAIGLLFVVLCIVGVQFSRTNSKLSVLSAQYASFDSGARRQLIGDPSVVEMGIRTGWATVFEDEGDQFLASFAIPGAPAGKRSVDASLLEIALAKPVLFDEQDDIEIRQLKHIVAEMKREIRGLVEGGWTLKEVGDALVKRQDEEARCYDRALNEINSMKMSGASEEKVMDLWQRRNAQLRKIEVKTLSLPDEKK